MPKQIQLPDGSIGQFPDSMSDAAIEGVLKKQFPAPAAPVAGPWSRFLSSAVAPLKGAVQSFSGTATPEEQQKGLTSVYDEALRPFERVIEAQTGQVHEAQDLAKQGRYSEAARMVSRPPSLLSARGLRMPHSNTLSRRRRGIRRVRWER